MFFFRISKHYLNSCIMSGSRRSRRPPEKEGPSMLDTADVEMALAFDKSDVDDGAARTAEGIFFNSFCFC